MMKLLSKDASLKRKESSLDLQSHSWTSTCRYLTKMKMVEQKKSKR